MSEPPRFFSTVIEAGYELTLDAYGYLAGLPGDAAEALIRRAIAKADSAGGAMLALDKSFLTALIETPSIAPKTRLQGQAVNTTSSMVVHPDDPAEPATSPEGFVGYFRSRFEQLEAIMKRRVDLREAVNISSALKMPTRQKLKVIGLVNEKRSRGSRLFLEIEDRDSSISVMATDGQVIKKGLEVQEDQVVGVDGAKYTEDLIVANDFIFPDIPSGAPHRSREPLCACFIADVHIGSKYFRGDLFNRFLRWINQEIGPPQSRELAGRVKYLICAGDLVDGVGIYPEQLNELDTTDINEQYNEAANMLGELPPYVDIALIPGNHDACRHSLPQPPVSRAFAKSLYEDPRVRMLPSPSRLNLCGVEVLAEHGTALNDVLSSMPGYDFMNPIKAMELLFRCRHLAPRYGQSTPIAPERRDRLVIREIPDVFVMGHVHVNASKRYRDSTLISLGAWQDQTPFQRRVNIEPAVGIASVVDLQTHQVWNIDFKNFS